MLADQSTSDVGPKTNTKNKLYYFYHESFEGYIFVDRDAKFVGSVQDDAGDHIDEFKFLAAFFDGELVRIYEPYMIPDNPEDDLQEDPFMDEDGIRTWIEKSKDLIVEGIRLTENDANDLILAADEELFEEQIVNHVEISTETSTNVSLAIANAAEKAVSDAENFTKHVQTEQGNAKKKSMKTKKNVPMKAKKSAPKSKPAKKTPSKKPTKGGGKKKK